MSAAAVLAHHTPARPLPPVGVVKLRRGLTARVFAECEDMRDVYSWFLMFLQDLQEKALLQVEQDDPTRQVRAQHGTAWQRRAQHGRAGHSRAEQSMAWHV